jgi:hypothetical protein
MHSLLEENALLRRILVKMDLVLKKVVETNRLMLPSDDRSLQADFLDTRRPNASASNTGGGDLGASAADQRFAARRSEKAVLWYF